MAVRLEETLSQCKHCNSSFIVKNSVQTFCSKSCRKKAYYLANAETEKLRTDKYKANNPLVAKGIKLKRYGITTDTYYQMLKSQNGVCKICSQACLTGRELCVDHCHTTGKVRGLLCGKCNSGLGSFNDNIQSLKMAIEYLEDKGVN